MDAMIRIVLVVLALLAAPAYAQMGREDIEDQVNRLDTRWYKPYERTMTNRDFFAELHDTIYHPNYKKLVAGKDKYRSLRSELVKELKGGNNSAATRKMLELEEAGKELSEVLEAYSISSESGVNYIYIGLGVTAFLIGGLGWLVFRRFRKR